MGIQIVKKIGQGRSEIIEAETIAEQKFSKEDLFIRYIAEKLRDHKIQQIKTSVGNLMNIEEFESLEGEHLIKSLNTVVSKDGKSLLELDSEFHAKNKKEATDISFVILEDGKCHGGIFGVIENNVLYIEILWIDEALRGKSLGRQLLDLIEKCAQTEYSCTQSKVTSTTYQATWLYENAKSKYHCDMEVSIPYKTVKTKLDVNENGSLTLDIVPDHKAHYARWYSKKLS